jgi:hypothetical protein
MEVNAIVFADIEAGMKKVARALEKSTAAALKQIGANVRRTAQTSMRYATKKSPQAAPPGKPPKAHKPNAFLRKQIIFVVDGNRVVVGPTKSAMRAGNVPKVQEFGGSTTMTNRKTGVRRVVTVRPHPFMGPALERESPTFPDYWKGSLQE